MGYLVGSIRDRYESGETCLEIAKDYGVTAAAIRYHVLKEGGAMRTRSEVKKGTLNPNYAGLEAKTLVGLHKFIRKLMPPTGVCARCAGNFNKLDLANITGEYKRSINDWIYLCRKCHMEMDGRMHNLKQWKGSTPPSIKIARRHGWRSGSSG